MAAFICKMFLKSNSASYHMFFNRGFASTLLVKGISFSSTEQSIAEAFSKYGKVVQVEIIMNKTLNRPKGLAFVTFYQEDEAQRALAEMNGELVDGRVVFVDNVRPIGHSTRKRRKD